MSSRCHHHLTEPLSPHLLVTTALAQAPLPGSSGDFSLLPWRLRRKAIDRSNFGRIPDETRNQRLPPEDETPALPTVADIMTHDVVSVATATPVSEIAKVLTNKRISAVPVVGTDGNLVGVVSESDLIRRVEIGTQCRRSWWRRLLHGVESVATDYVRVHGGKARHIMTPHVITASEDITLADLAEVMEKRRLKRLPVVRNKRLVGIISRSDLVKAVARHQAPSNDDPRTDEAILQDLMARMNALTPSHRLFNVSVHRGSVNIVGIIDGAAEREAILVAAENTPGVRSIQDRMMLRPRATR